MALTITATITVADDQTYTPREAAILTALQAHPSQGAAAVVVTNPNTHTAAQAAEKVAVEPAPAAKAAAPKAARTSTRAAVLEDTPEPVVEEPAAAEEDLVGGAKEYTLDDAVTLATQFVSDGKAPAVKAALAAAGGAKRVSELKGDNIATFITTLEG